MQKLNIQQLPEVLKETVKADYTDNVLTLTSTTGDEIVVDLSNVGDTDNLFKDASYSTTTHKITFTKNDDTTKEVDISELVNKVETIKVNGTAVTITNKAVDISVPTKVSQLTNDSRFDTEENVDNKIAAVAETLGTSQDVSTGSFGDIAIMPYSNEAPAYYQRRNQGIYNTEIDGVVGYRDELPRRLYLYRTNRGI